jgi:hypothetical protein
MITLTEEERAILNHVVEDADDWASRPVVTREHVDAKVAKHKQSYLDAQGDGYKTRQQHEDAFAKEEQEQHDNVTYDVKRKREYNNLNQFEMQFDDQRDGTTTWVDAINTIKGKYSKE